MALSHWDRVDSQVAPAVALAAPPVTVIGRWSDSALLVDSLPEAQRVKQAFAAIGWTIEPGHERVLMTGFSAHGEGLSIALSFDSPDSQVTCWVMTTATLTQDADLAPVPRAGELETLGRVVRAVETAQFSLGGLIQLGRGLNWPGVNEEWLPEPIAYVSREDHAVLPASGRDPLEIVPVPDGVRTLAVGYRFHLPEDEAMAAALIQHTVDTLPRVCEWLSDLQAESPDRFMAAFGPSLPTPHSWETREALTLSSGLQADDGPTPGSPTLTKSASGLGGSSSGLTKTASGLGGSSPGLTKSASGLGGSGSPWAHALSQGQGVDLREELDRARRLMSGLGIVMSGSDETSPEAGYVYGIHHQSPMQVDVNISSTVSLVTIQAGIGFQVPLTHEMLQWLALREPAPGFVWSVESIATGSIKTCSVIMRATVFTPYTDERLVQMLTSATGVMDSTARFRARFGALSRLGEDG